MAKINCQTKTKINTQKVKVRIVKAPIVDNRELRQIMFFRAKAIVL
jgi:hypothetical protein